MKDTDFGEHVMEAKERMFNADTETIRGVAEVAPGCKSATLKRHGLLLALQTVVQDLFKDENRDEKVKALITAFTTVSSGAEKPKTEAVKPPAVITRIPKDFKKHGTIEPKSGISYISLISS